LVNTNLETERGLFPIFAEVFGIPPPDGMLPEEPLRPLAKDAHLFGSEVALSFGALVLQAHLEHFLEQAPEGYLLAGFWGHGIQSYAFYYARVDARSRVYFRLPYGGVYTDNERAALKIRAFLTRYFAIEPAIRARASSFVAVEAMGTARYDVHGKDGTRVELETSLFHDAAFEERFAAVLGASQGHKEGTSP
jgi:hypothetical protein